MHYEDPYAFEEVHLRIDEDFARASFHKELPSSVVFLLAAMARTKRVVEEDSLVRAMPKKRKTEDEARARSAVQANRPA